MPESVEPITVEELRAIDAQYQPFPAFSEWPKTLPREDLWDRRLAELGDLREEVDPTHLSRAVEIAMRAAAFNTGAIEGLYASDRGLTITVATQAMAWDDRLREHGDNVLELFEAQLRTYELVLDVATKRLPVNEAWIRQLHEELTGPQETYRVVTPSGEQDHQLPRGEYKAHPNHVRLEDGTIHAYAPADLTGPEMARLVGELQSEEFLKAHPVIQAAYAHYALVAIHPFADGNGRVARALASVYLLRPASIPLLVFAEDKLFYFDALATADEGDGEPFNAFVFDAAIAALGMVLESLRAALAPSPEDALRDFRIAITSHEGLTHQELDAIAIRLADFLIGAFGKRFAELEFPPGVTPGAGSVSGTFPQPVVEGFRPIAQVNQRFVQLTLTSVSPAEATVAASFYIYVSTEADAFETFLIAGPEADSRLAFTLRELLHPEVSVSAQQRLAAFVERVLGERLAELLAAGKKSLRAAGYPG